MSHFRYGQPQHSISSYIVFESVLTSSVVNPTVAVEVPTFVKAVINLGIFISVAVRMANPATTLMAAIAAVFVLGFLGVVVGLLLFIQLARELHDLDGATETCEKTTSLLDHADLMNGADGAEVRHRLATWGKQRPVKINRKHCHKCILTP